MRPTTTTHRFTRQELEDLKKQTNTENGEEALKKWARHNYPIRKTGYISIRSVDTDGEGGKISIDER